MQRAQLELGQAKAYFVEVFPGTPTARAVQDWDEGPTWIGVRGAQSLPDGPWATFWELAFESTWPRRRTGSGENGVLSAEALH
jgi:hypothetical protein